MHLYLPISFSFTFIIVRFLLLFVNLYLSPSSSWWAPLYHLKLTCKVPTPSQKNVACLPNTAAMSFGFWKINGQATGKQIHFFNKANVLRQSQLQAILIKGALRPLSLQCKNGGKVVRRCEGCTSKNVNGL